MHVRGSLLLVVRVHLAWGPGPLSGDRPQQRWHRTSASTPIHTQLATAMVAQ